MSYSHFTEPEMSKKKPRLLLLGGPDNAGKTTTLDCLIEIWPEYYRRPKSYTTRDKRSDEGFEYEFINSDEMSSLQSFGRLANLDVYRGHQYAIDKTDLEHGLAQGLTICKEVHPNNWEKLRAQYTNTITAYIHRWSADDGLDGVDWQTYEEALLADIPLNRQGLEPREAAEFLHHQLLVEDYYANRFPNGIAADSTNRTGYSLVAPHFSDAERPTTSAFHELSLPALSDLLERVPKSATVLELAPGNGWLRTNISFRPSKYHSLDIAEPMKDLNEQKGSHVVGSARLIPFSSGCFDLVCGSLIDSLLHPNTIIEIGRVLKGGGSFIYSTPSSVWARSIRPPDRQDRTSFKLPGGEEVSVFSFCHTIEELLPAFSLGSLSLSRVQVVHGNDEISPKAEAIVEASNRTGLPFWAMPIVNVVELVKI